MDGDLIYDYNKLRLQVSQPLFAQLWSPSSSAISAGARCKSSEASCLIGTVSGRFQDRGVVRGCAWLSQSFRLGPSEELLGSRSAFLSVPPTHGVFSAAVHE